MEKRKRLFVAKRHKHKYILDENSFGRCKYPRCKATKQFPVERKLTLRPSEVLSINSLGSEAGYDPDSWLNATSQDFEVKT